MADQLAQIVTVRPGAGGVSVWYSRFESVFDDDAIATGRSLMPDASTTSDAGAALAFAAAAAAGSSGAKTMPRPRVEPADLMAQHISALLEAAEKEKNAAEVVDGVSLAGFIATALEADLDADTLGALKFYSDRIITQLQGLDEPGNLLAGFRSMLPNDSIEDEEEKTYEM